MPGILDAKASEIAAACQRLGIERLFVFGSVLRDDFKPGESDIDLLVEFGPLEVTKRVHPYLAAREAFRSILQADVDLVMQGAVHRSLKPADQGVDLNRSAACAINPPPTPAPPPPAPRGRFQPAIPAAAA